MSFAYRFFSNLFRITLKLFFRFRVIDDLKIPAEGGVIVVSNHVSYLDPLVMGAVMRKRQATFMARSGLFRIPLVGTFVKTFSFPVDRDNPRPSTIKEAVRRLKKGELIVMFPEGGRSKDGSLLDAKRGVCMIAALSGAKIIPAFIDGTFRALPAGARLIRPARISVIFGDPVEVSGGKAGKDFHERIGSDIMESIRRLKAKVKVKE